VLDLNDRLVTLVGLTTSSDVTRAVGFATLNSTAARGDEPVSPSPVPADSTVRR
jgi:hypothetical protein